MATLKEIFSEIIDDRFTTVSEGEVLSLEISKKALRLLLP